MAFLVGQDLNMVLYSHFFPHKIGQINALKTQPTGNSPIDISQWRVLATINERTKENSVGSISLKAISEKKCICGQNVSHYCLIGNKITGDILRIGFDCLKKYFSGSLLFQEYKLSRKLIRKCKKCHRKFLVTDMVGQCCDQCKEHRTSQYFGCVSCLSYEKGIAGALQCINCQIAKRPYFRIIRFPGKTLEETFEEVSELVHNGIGFDLVNSYDLNKEIKLLLEPQERCIQCGTAINLQEQLRTVPIDQVLKCVRCVYPNHGRCVECNKFMPEMTPGKDKCLTCFKKFMRKCPKRQCETCGLMEIPNVPSNTNRTQCYSCWKKSTK